MSITVSSSTSYYKYAAKMEEKVTESNTKLEEIKSKNEAALKENSKNTKTTTSTKGTTSAKDIANDISKYSSRKGPKAMTNEEISDILNSSSSKSNSIFEEISTSSMVDIAKQYTYFKEHLNEIKKSLNELNKSAKLKDYQSITNSYLDKALKNKESSKDEKNTSISNTKMNSSSSFDDIAKKILDSNTVSKEIKDSLKSYMDNRNKDTKEVKSSSINKKV